MTRGAAMLIIVMGATFMSFVGLLLRLLETQDGLLVLFYRSFTLAAVVGLVACMRRKQSPAGFLGCLDRTDVAMGLAFGASFFTHVYALILTSVASALLLLSLSPFMAAILGWLWIGERPHRYTWPAMAAAVVGVTLMINDGVELGRTAGNLTALASAACFATGLVLARRSGRSDALGGTFLGGVFALVVAGAAAATIGSGFAISTPDLAITLFMGGCTIGIGIALVTWGTGYVPAAEVGLLVLVESVLGPIWPWIFLGEAMSPVEIVGGSIVLGAVAGLTIATRRSPARPTRGTMQS